jgi:hypothetical protein
MELFSLCWHSVPSLISGSFPLTNRFQAVQNTFDILGGVLYILCVLMEGAIFACHLIWLFRTRKIRAQAEAEGKAFDDIAEEHRQQGVEFAFAEREFRFSRREQTFEEDAPIEADIELGIGKQD